MPSYSTLVRRASKAKGAEKRKLLDAANAARRKTRKAKKVNPGSKQAEKTLSGLTSNAASDIPAHMRFMEVRIPDLLQAIAAKDIYNRDIILRSMVANAYSSGRREGMTENNNAWRRKLVQSFVDGIASLEDSSAEGLPAIVHVYGITAAALVDHIRELGFGRSE